MGHILTFQQLLEYDNSQVGITLDVELRLANVSVSAIAKVDTGASHCIFERQIAEALGILVNEGYPKVFRTPTGRFNTYGHGVTLVFGEFELDSQVFFSEYEGFYPNVLGRQGWLDRIDIAITDNSGKLYLSPVG